jgi:lincosamide nucleotidyltransferase A/C/D/E
MCRLALLARCSRAYARRVVEHVMSAEAAVEVLKSLSGQRVTATVGGGWAVDALLARQTRVHSDLDLWLAADEFEGVVVAMVQLGIDRLFPWPGDRPWNFVLHDGATRRVDLHLYEEVAPGVLHYGPGSSGDRFSAAVLRGQGTIGGTAVVCETPEWALECHTGYAPRAADHDDVRNLTAQFGLPLPESYR